MMPQKTLSELRTVPAGLSCLVHNPPDGCPADLADAPQAAPTPAWLFRAGDLLCSGLIVASMSAVSPSMSWISCCDHLQNQTYLSSILTRSKV